MSEEETQLEGPDLKAGIERWPEACDCTITFRNGGRKLAVAVIHRDFEGLRPEGEFWRTIAERAGRPATGGEPA